MLPSPPSPGQVIQSGDETKQIVCKLVVASGLLTGPLQSLQLHKRLCQGEQWQRGLEGCDVSDLPGGWRGVGAVRGLPPRPPVTGGHHVTGDLPPALTGGDVALVELDDVLFS